ncbi:UvrD-helicase domain-containing protein [Bradyrhizobium sp. 38]|uniref:UvrD-helicase domain-containing protein n=1 Tax=unclassified Bradyrhizobium TaxID=2631580 RepID=UPI001FFBD411|nr:MULTISPECIES: UvrD-helicase domain-containing protein [unclassified Bradyrhizobium]MCK1341540.1 UvrD-helicase domain-containing protein [Bradyrhizobium sp. 38]MCK1778929.1 UvrD-helicase domain-containing protein [Bradyrhizobium sp. 132]
MTLLADNPARLRAVTELGATLLVEAAAGTGKTALMAARLTMLLAHGAEPGSIAAITFTELAASALAARVHHYVDELLAGRVPKPLQGALSDGLNEAQRRALSAAADKLDELSTATIHAFCKTIICSYAVEADIDPGARILDATQAEAAFNSVFEQWFKRRLNGSARADDPVAALSQFDPRHVVATLRALARFSLEHRGARTPAADLSGRPDMELAEAVADFRRWLSAQPVEPKTLDLMGQLETLARHFAGSFETPPSFETLWRLAHPGRLPCMRRRTFELLTPKTKTAWEKAAGKDRGAQLNEEAGVHFARVARCYRVILGRIAGALVAKLADELDEVLADYAAFKRAAAVLDFDDLLERARRLVCEHDALRRELGRRYRYIFVDEFQDTDPTQAEILFMIAADDRPARWQDSALRAGALFMVGDPKQSIYRFRGADVASYGEARAAISRRWPENIVQITANFRSRPEILTHTNRCFATPLSGRGQPGYVALAPTIDQPDHNLPCAAKIRIDVPPDSRPAQIRDAEAEAVADLCARLIGNLNIRDDNGDVAPLSPGGIALLAPTGAELWRYERALETRGLPIASQAGKGLFRRQEVQDFVALARVLADAGDTLAFGALMRGPLVGLTEEQLLDITAALPPHEDRPHAIPRFSLMAEADHVIHPTARRVLSILKDLHRRARVTTPALLLAEAAERLAIRPILSAREGDRSARAAANIEAVLERARPYDVKGLKRFVRDISRDWRVGEAYDEGRIDAEGDAIELMTVHSAKGLEWPVVIPINTATLLRSREPFVHRAGDDTLHWVIGDVVPPELIAALETDHESLMRERERLWYVACTRARELLVVPELPEAEQKSWARIVDMAHDVLPRLDVSRMTPRPVQIIAEPPNRQTAELFAAERASIDAAAVPLTWVRPSDHDVDRISTSEAIALEGGDAPEIEAPVGAGRVRGLLLHKLMEEVLTGELAEDAGGLAARARELIGQLPLDAAEDGVLPNADEITATALRALHLPEVAALRMRLVPEWPIYSVLPDRPEAIGLAGRIDAIAYDGERADVVIDWKSDFDPSETDMRLHAEQIQQYLRATGASRGALVYMTPGIIRWIGCSPAA